MGQAASPPVLMVPGRTLPAPQQCLPQRGSRTQTQLLVPEQQEGAAGVILGGLALAMEPDLGWTSSDMAFSDRETGHLVAPSTQSLSPGDGTQAQPAPGPAHWEKAATLGLSRGVL